MYVVGIFKQTRRTDGDGCFHGVEEGEEVVNQPVGQLRTKEIAQNDGIRHIAQGHLVKIVRVHKLVEDVRAEHDGLGDGHGGVFKRLELHVTLHQVVDESQATAFASQRPFPDAGKVRIAVKTLLDEFSHDAAVFHLTVFHDGIKDDLPVCVDILVRVTRDALQEFSHGKHGTRVEPAGDMVARDVVVERLARHREDDALQVFQVAHAGDFLHRSRVTEDEITETEVLRHGLTQVDVHLLGILVDEARPAAVGKLPVGTLRRLHDEGDVRVMGTDFREQACAGFRVFFALTGKRRIGDDTQDVVTVLPVERDSLLIGAGQHDLGTATHTQRALVGIERLRGKLAALLKHKAVEAGKNG